MKCYNLRYVWVWYWSVAVVWWHIGACNIDQHSVTFLIICEVPTAFGCHKHFHVTHITAFMKTVKIPHWNIIQCKRKYQKSWTEVKYVLKHRDTEISFCAVLLTGVEISGQVCAQAPGRNPLIQMEYDALYTLSCSMSSLLPQEVESCQWLMHIQFFAWTSSTM